MIKNYESFIIEKNLNLHLKYYAFDIDSNLLHMPTKVHMEHLIDGKWIPEDISPSKFSLVRTDEQNWRFIGGDNLRASQLTFNEFGDDGPRGEHAFINDAIQAISKGDFGPCWNTFLKCLEQASLFALITARKHEPKTLRKFVEYVIDNIFDKNMKEILYKNCLKFAKIFNSKLKYGQKISGRLSKMPVVSAYLDDCDFWGVNADSFVKEFNIDTSILIPNKSDEKRKELALNKFIDKCNNFGKIANAGKVSIGFSDDDKRTSAHIEKFFGEKLLDFDFDHSLDMHIFDTSKKEIEGGIKKKVKKPVIKKQPVKESSTGVSSQTTGMESSIMPYSSFNNITARLFPSEPGGQDGPWHINNLASNYVAKISKQYITPNKKKNKKKKRRKYL